jgi:hypothetical protein
MNRAI